ncbi:NADPH-dependent F420 reductase [Spirosoma soli]|uniref:NADPH-dependent F420 reductase n=1 Tax=Spirosoma soli TaxID=1770529 RepID=A0ABW5M4X8_9BACT
MKIGIIGAGGIGQAFASQVAKAGYEVIISNSREPSSLTEVVNRLGGNVTAGTVKQAAQADVIFLAIPWNSLNTVMTSVPSWEGKIIIDPTNPILPGFRLANLNGKTSSEVVADQAPGARVVKAFNTLTPHVLGAEPNQAGGKRVIFYSGNDTPANEIVGAIIERIGFAGVHLGRLAEGGKLQQFPGGPLPTLNLIRIG